ncbi:LuxR C-terminal-related transcriptional regulator [Amphritea balenae]|uniref:DNA-binding response regulator n=1 Tax=Amphritea balenae TaxID=452629 RepID=A0A3P1SR18_9GAMM|nr:response regulator transcription factor [Amphritea balenae]RRC99354.1 DNA-binding response regulator [Amphritea balenae]GGK71828.1 DNA-binding response regulator [Amphritea balenae]
MKIYIADSSPLYCSGIEQLLKQMGITTVVESFNQFASLQQALMARQDSAMLIIDACLPGLDSLEKLKSLAAERSDRILMVSDNKDLALMRRMLFNGARGAVAKTASLEELQQAIKTVLEGRSWRYEQDNVEPWLDQETRLGYALRRLSNQENNVLRFVRTGLRNKQIASEMELTEHTIKTHMSNILRKLEIENRTQLVVAIKNVEIDQPQPVTA